MINAFRPFQMLRRENCALQGVLGVAPFSLSDLFASGQDGLAFAIKNASIYQESTGQTVADTDADPVGLVIDQSLGGLGSLGAECSPDVGFDIPLEWTLSEHLTIVDGQLINAPEGTSSGNAAVAASAVPFKTNHFYQVEIDLATEVTSPGVYVRAQFGPLQAIVASGPAGLYKAVVKAGGDGTSLYINPRTDCTINSVSVREIPGYHFAQSLSASRPLLDINGNVHSLIFDGSDDYLAIASLAAFTGGVVLAGTDGIYVNNSHTHAGGEFAIGKKTGVDNTYTGGTAGVMTNIGQFIGPAIRSTAFSDAELANIVALFQAEGAGALL